MEFILQSSFPVTAEKLYNCWLNSSKHSAMTGGEAKITDKEGAEFSAWDGYISGKNLVLEPYTRIVQTWRTTEFGEDEPDSEIEITLDESFGTTEITLTHRNLPAHGEQYRKGWEDHYFAPMQKYFST